MIIRDAGSADAAPIAQFWSPQITETAITFSTEAKTPTQVAQMIVERPCFLVAERGGDVLGFVTYDQFRPGPGYRHTAEHTIILAPDARGQGTGRALMEAAVARGRAQQLRVFVAAISGENAAAVKFHHAIGFQTVGQMPQVGRKFDRWMDLILMQKQL